MKNFISKRLAMIAIVISIVALSGSVMFAAEKVHKHSYAKEWTYDETSHWHKATCEHADEINGKAAHKFGNWSSNKDATCCIDGTKSRVCKDCKYKETVTDEGSATGKHPFEKTWVGDETGHWHPAACGNKEAKGNFTAKHKFGKFADNTKATCDKNSTKARVCSECGFKDVVENPDTKTNKHTFAKTWTSDEKNHWHAATCESTEVSGLTAHSFGKYISNNDATCDKDGTKYRICSVCKYQEASVTDAGSKKPHTYAKEFLSDETNHWHAATCEHKDEISVKQTHNYGAYVSNKDGTCSKDGTKSAKCKDCGYVNTITDEGSKTDHPYANEWTNDEKNHWHAATCEHKDKVSELSEHEYKRDWHDGHEIIYNSNKDATCTQDGTKSAECLTCGYLKTVTDKGSKKDHKSDKGTVTKAATSKTEGEKVYKCSVCGETIKTEVIPKLYAFHETVEKVDSVTYNGTKYDIVTFGDYPQTVKAEDVKVDESNYVDMGRFRYYLGSDGFYYAKVTFKEKPQINYSENPENYDEEYIRYYNWDGGKEYFKVEPIRWRVLTKNYNGTKKALLLAEKYLENGINFSGTSEERTINKKTVYSTNYQHSNVRAFLNGISFTNKNEEYGTNFTDKTWENKGFLQTAFTSAAQGKITVTTVDNSVSSTQDEAKKDYTSDVKYVCENTKDKIFLLSQKEITTASYGFGLYDKSSASRKPEKTNYTLIKAPWSTNSGILRSPCDSWSGGSYIKAIFDGYSNNSGMSYDNYSAGEIYILPALTIAY